MGRVALPKFPCGCISSIENRKGGQPKMLPDKSRVCMHGRRWVMTWQEYRAKEATRGHA